MLPPAAPTSWETAGPSARPEDIMQGRGGYEYWLLRQPKLKKTEDNAEQDGNEGADYIAK